MRKPKIAMFSRRPNATKRRERPSSSSKDQEAIHSAYQLSSIVIQVREDLHFHVREVGGTPSVLIEDSLGSRFFRIGIAEYTFLSLLDGQTTFAAALGKTAGIMKERALTEQKAAQFCQWLVESGLATTANSRSIERMETMVNADQDKRTRGWWNMVSQRIPLFQPDRWVDRVYATFGWLFSTPAMLLGVLLIISASAALWLNWKEFIQGAPQIIARDNWIRAIGIWLVLRVLHESAHAIVCKRFGGHVREAGILFVLLMPLPYVDLTSTWRLTSKWERILTSVAGMFAELVIASVAFFVWLFTSDDLLHQQAYNLVWIAGISTLLFNANPLMRFDGYYILSDLVERPNLAAQGQRSVNEWRESLLFGKPTGPQTDTPRWVFLYGIAVLLWRMLLFLGIGVSLEKLMPGLGLVFAGTLIYRWFISPAMRWSYSKYQSGELRARMFLRPSMVLGSGVAALATLWFIPVPGREQVAAVVDYYPQYELRTSAGGFIEEWFVVPGEELPANSLVAWIDNKELTTRRNEVAVEIAIAQQRSDGFLQGELPAARDVELERILAKESQLAELDKQLAGLQVRAPFAGVVLSEGLNQRTGTYVQEGELMAVLGSSEKLELVALVSQAEYESFQNRIGEQVRVHVDGLGYRWENAELIELQARATRMIPHPALTALAGGEHSVRAVAQGDGVSGGQEHEKHELTEPCFLARISVPARWADRLRRGQAATIAIRASEPTFGWYVYRKCNHWIDRTTAEIQKAWYASPDPNGIGI